jgi:hypothetical protein
MIVPAWFEATPVRNGTAFVMILAFPYQRTATYKGPLRGDQLGVLADWPWPTSDGLLRDLRDAAIRFWFV